MTNAIHASRMIRRRAFLAGPAVQLIAALAADGRVRLNVFRSRDGRSACLLGHLAMTPPLRADGWHFVNGIPHWAGRMGVAAAEAYFGIGPAEALDIFGTSSESRAACLADRLQLMENMLQRNIFSIRPVAARCAG